MSTLKYFCLSMELVIVCRTGKTVSLIVRTENEEDSVEEGESPGTYSVLDLNPVSSKFYVGGVPENVGVSNCFRMNYRNSCDG